jgi:hypothetical protein
MGLFVVPWLRVLVACLSLRRPEFAPRSFRMGFVVDSTALGWVSTRFPREFPVDIVTQWLCNLISSVDEQQARWWAQFRDMVST